MCINEDEMEQEMEFTHAPIDNTSSTAAGRKQGDDGMMKTSTRLVIVCPPIPKTDIPPSLLHVDHTVVLPLFFHQCILYGKRLDLHEWVPEETDELATKDDIFSFDRSFTARTGSFGGSIGRDGSVGLIDDGLNAVEDDGDFHMEWMNIQYDE
eukprot:gnl/Carplike_NY0171/13125_a19093_116.p1 GENE.gnl/Carplike_NY0171/13125_a19093_116~~gnl/Carplike_NY0171/13125_a19093_116.p1  ORF type:complete len:180 (+),score=42.07 gnl/Carplike_NY0171/13125_a19093_116:82-540(+)